MISVVYCQVACTIGMCRGMPVPRERGARAQRGARRVRGAAEDGARARVRGAQRIEARKICSCRRDDTR